MASSPRPPEWANKIKSGALMDRLHKHGNGEIEMSQSQIAAAKLFLSKTLPDLARTEIKNPEGETFKTEATLSEGDREILARFLSQQK